jgi:cytochrome c
MSADPFQPLSMPLVISAIVAVVLVATHAGIALAIVRGVAGDDGEARGTGKRFFLRVALVLMALELALVPVTAWTLAPAGLTTRTLLAIGLGHLCLLASIAWVWAELAAPRLGSPRTRHAIGAFLLFCVSLVIAKLVHQDEASHAYLVANPPKPKPVVVAAAPTVPAPTTPIPATAPVTTTPPAATQPVEVDPVFAKGEKVFKTTCIVCHALDTRLVGPPIRELVKDYQGNPDGIAKWAKAPGKKRPDYPPMIPVPLPDEDLRAAGVYMLKVAEQKK